MSSRNATVVALLAIAGIAAFLLINPFGNDPGSGPAPTDGIVGSGTGELVVDDQIARDAAESADSMRTQVDIENPTAETVIRGVVLDARTMQPLAGVDVAAMKRPPSIERLMSRFRNAFMNGEGFYRQTSQPAEVLAKTTTLGDGSFELRGVDPGRVFLDARSDYTFVRIPIQVRVAAGETQDGIELLASPGGRITGTVRDEGGVPLSNVVVSVRPGLNSFLGQMTQKKYRWMEAVTDELGSYDLRGVPEGSGYSLSAAGPTMAIEEVYGIGVREGEVTNVDIEGHPGAFVSGVVKMPDGTPAVGASVAMVYLDVSRILFSADGREEPIETDENGRFVLERVAAGRIGFVAASDGLAPSEIQDLTVVDGGRYEDIELSLGEGLPFEGTVMDTDGQGIANATVHVRTMDRPKDPDILKMALKVRKYEVRTGPDGRFVASGLDNDRLFVEVSKPGYVTEVRFGVKRDEEFKLEMVRGVTVRGRVVDAEGPVARFRVSSRSRKPRPEGEEGQSEDRGRRGPPWMRGRRGRDGGFQMRAGQRMGDREFGDRWTEVQSVDGRFELRDIPPGEVTVSLRADGYRSPEGQTVTLEPGQKSEEILFELEAGAAAEGIVVDAVTKTPVPDATVTAYQQREGRRGGMFKIDPEDFDFLGMMQGSQRTARTDSTGRFMLDGLAGGDYRFTARHPDMAKASAKDVTIEAGIANAAITIEIDAGGGVEGTVTGAGMKPLHDALIVAMSIQAGAMKSDSSDENGYYKIEGLPPGQYIVFKSRMDERSSNLGYDLMGNMRLKTVTVRRGKFKTLDIHDETENSVRVYGVVRDGGEPVSRAMVTALGADADGIFGMGVRAQPTDKNGKFELIGLEPGEYYFQVTRFRGRPEQANLSVEIPEGAREMRVDLDLPQSYITGRVIDTSGNPVQGITVRAGVEEGGVGGAPGLLGIILKNEVARDRTDENGEFKLNRMSSGVYRLVASGRARGGRGGFGRRERDEQSQQETPRYGDAMAEGIAVDGNLPIENVVITLPLAGTITGTVVDGSGNPLPGAEIHYSRDEGDVPTDAGSQMMDLFGVQRTPMKSDGNGRFELKGITPGTYRVRADAEGLSPGVADDVLIAEGGQADVMITVVKGATLRLRAKNIDGGMIPFANVTVLDGKGKPLASRVSVMSVFKRFMGNKEKKSNTGWYEVGSVPPDTYTVIVREEGQPDLRVTREIRDGETVEWDIDVALELEASGRSRK